MENPLSIFYKNYFFLIFPTTTTRIMKNISLDYHHHHRILLCIECVTKVLVFWKLNHWRYRWVESFLSHESSLLINRLMSSLEWVLIAKWVSLKGRLAPSYSQFLFWHHMTPMSKNTHSRCGLSISRVVNWTH